MTSEPKSSSFNVLSQLARIASYAIFLTACCGCSAQNVMPPSQQAFHAEWEAIAVSYAEAKKTRNELKLAPIEERARILFLSKPQILGWLGRIDHIDSFLDKPYVVVKTNGITYRLKTEEKKLGASFAEFSAGDLVEFTGQYEMELSFTAAGSIREPEISVTLQSINLAK